MKITGLVTDANGEPIIGANILVKGTTNGMISDINGNFSLDVPETGILQISYIGYVSQEIKIVSGMKNYKIVLKEDAETLDEVVVVRYGTVKKTDVTGSVTSVKSDEMMKRNPVSLGQGLQGAAAGVSVMRTSGDPEGGVSIRIRGVATVNGSADPLYVVDGVQVGTSVDFLNPADVESIEILKDASATAIYGSQGANGVILITTKPGVKGHTSLKFTANFGLQTLSDKLDVANATQFVTGIRASKVNDNAVFTNKAWENPDFTNRLNSIDWQDQMARTALQQNYNLSASGGSDKTQSRLSVGYLNNDGVIVNSYYKRLTARVNVTHKVQDFIRVGMSVTYLHAEKTGGGNLFSYARTIPTMDDVDASGNLMNAPVQYPDGTWGHFRLEGNGDLSKEQDNPYAAAMTADYLNKYNRALTSATLEIDLLKGLTFKTIGSYNYYGSAYDRYTPNNPRTYMDQSRPDAFNISSTEGNSLGLESYLTYDLKLKNQRLNLMGGYSVSDYKGSEVGASSQSLVAETIRQITLTKDMSTITGRGGFYTPVCYVSWYGRANYSLMDKYLFTATVRRDGSSKFGSGNRFGTFPSASLAWRASEEEFIKKLNIFSNLKVRVGWGKPVTREMPQTFP
ncbi:MAG: SusC/RagA family TonB-linked outer membrane protein [Bacteroides sp.]|nr:SusC/RagA family TonB-linked outer membrane protein [Bacteroides sp.]